MNDILHSHSYTVNFYDSPHYYSGMSDACNGRSYNLNVTYTFGYGKKMQQDVDFDGASSKTGVVGR